MNTTFKYKTAVIALASLFLIFLPGQAYGKIPVVDLLNKQLDALGEWVAPFAAFFIYSFLYFAVGYISLLVAMWLLQGIIRISSTALTVTGSDVAELVGVGWNFSVGIVNLLLIIAFIVIAFAVMLGSERIQLKKALPRLIVVALLVNFTLLFVGAGIDISNFLYNTIVVQIMTGGETGNVFFVALSPLLEFGAGVMVSALAYMAIVAKILLVPIIATQAQISWVYAAGLTIPISFQFLFYGAIMWSLAGIFFTYFVVFLARIFIVQVLAIIAPLAFFCLIFDDTKKWWDKWVNALIQWLLVGVAFIFFMYIGFGLAPTVSTITRPFQPPIWIAWLTGDIVAHIALLVYFTVIIGIVKNLVPAAANVFISQVSGAIKAITPYAGAIAKGTGRRIRNAELERSERIKNTPKEKQGSLGYRWDQMKSNIVRWGHRAADTSVEEQTTVDQKTRVDNLERKYANNTEAAIRDYSRFATPTDQVAFMQWMATKGADGLNEMKSKYPEQLRKGIALLGRRGDQRTLLEINKHLPEWSALEDKEEELRAAIIGGVQSEIEEKRRDVAFARTMQKALSRTIKKDAEVQRLEGELKELLTQLESTTDPAARASKRAEITAKTKEIRVARVATTYGAAARSLKTQDVENLSSSTLKNPRFLMEILKNRDINFIRSLGARKEDGAEIMRLLDNITGAMTPSQVRQLKMANPTLCNQIKGTSGGQTMFGKLLARHGSLL